MGGSRRRLKKGKPKVRVGVQKKNKTLKAALPKDVADPTRRARTAACLAALRNGGGGGGGGAPSSGPSGAPAVPPAASLWREQAPVAQNYAAVALVADVNEAFGRNRRNRARPAGAAHDAPALRPPAARAAAGERTHEDDDELRAAMRLPRHSGKAAPQRLTSTARAVVESLLAVHGRGGGAEGAGEAGREGGGGGGLAAWVRDTKRNRMQHSEGKLRAMLEAYDYYGQGQEEGQGQQQGAEGAAAGGGGAGGGTEHRFQAPKKPYKRL